MPFSKVTILAWSTTETTEKPLVAQGFEPPDSPIQLVLYLTSATLTTLSLFCGQIDLLGTCSRTTGGIFSSKVQLVTIYQKTKCALAYSNYLHIMNNKIVLIGSSSRSIPLDYLMTEGLFRKKRDFFTSHLLTFYVDLFKMIKKEDLIFIFRMRPHRLTPGLRVLFWTLTILLLLSVNILN